MTQPMPSCAHGRPADQCPDCWPPGTRLSIPGGFFRSDRPITRDQAECAIRRFTVLEPSKAVCAACARGECGRCAPPCPCPHDGVPTMALGPADYWQDRYGVWHHAAAPDQQQPEPSRPLPFSVSRTVVRVLAVEVAVVAAVLLAMLIAAAAGWPP